MKILVGIITIIMLVSLMIYSTIHLFIAPSWMLAMIAYSSFFIYMILKELPADKKIKPFTLIELLTVVTLMTILLSMTMNILKPDKAATAIKQVGGNISIWNARATAEDTSYRMEFTKNLLEVYNINDELIYSEKIISDLSFFDHSDMPTTSQTIEFNKLGEMEDLQGAKIFADTWVARVNGFTGNLSYYEDEEE